MDDFGSYDDRVAGVLEQVRDALMEQGKRDLGGDTVVEQACGGIGGVHGHEGALWEHGKSPVCWGTAGGTPRLSASMMETLRYESMGGAVNSV